MKDKIIEIFAEKIAALLEMRTALAIAVCVIFCISVCNGVIGGEEVKSAFWMVLGWYANNVSQAQTAAAQKLPSPTE